MSYECDPKTSGSVKLAAHVSPADRRHGSQWWLSEALEPTPVRLDGSGDSAGLLLTRIAALETALNNQRSELRTPGRALT